MNNKDNAFYKHQDSRLSNDNHNQNIQEKILNDNLENLKKGSLLQIKILDGFEYQPFIKLFWNVKYLSELEEIVDELYKNKYYEELQKLKFSLDSFVHLLSNSNARTLKLIQNTILKPIPGLVYKIDVFNRVLNLSNDISAILYKHLSRFETFLKTAIVTVLQAEKRTVLEVSQIEIGKLEKWNDIKHSYNKDEPNNSWKLFEIINFGEIIDFLNKIRIEEQEILTRILFNLLGEHRISDIYKFPNEMDILEIRTDFVNKLNKIKALRNKVMHFDYILPTNNENILMDGLKALVNTSKRSLGNDNDGFLKAHTDVMSEIINFLNDSNSSELLNYFQKNIFSYDIYK